MPLGHMIIGLAGGIAAFVVALLAGLPFWLAALVLIGASNLAMLASLAWQLLLSRSAQPPPREPSSRSSAERLRPLRADR